MMRASAIPFRTNKSIRLPLLCAALFSGACSNSTDSLEPIYEACATDENWRTFDDYETTGRVVSDQSVTAKWVMPTSDMSYSAASSPILQWQPSSSSAGTPDGDATCPQFQPTSLGKLGPLHLPAVSGTIYDLHFASGGQDVYRVITTRQRTGVPANVFQSWAGKSVTVTLFEAKMLMNEITTGPAQTAPITLQITQ